MGRAIRLAALGSPLFVALALASGGQRAAADRVCVDVTVYVTQPPPGATACVPIPSTTLP